MNAQQALAKLDQLPLAPPEKVSETPPSVGHMLAAVIEKGVSAENVAAVEQLVKLYERMEDRNAEKAFAEAFVALQSEMPNVKAMKPVPNNDGTVRFKYAPFEEIMTQVGPLLKKHGFTVSFSTDYDDRRLIKHCTLQHIAGHKQTTHFAVRIGAGPPKATETQSDGAASTYAKRFALCEALNIICSTDTNAMAEGDVISEAQATELHRRVQETNANEPAFLKFCGVKPSEPPTFEDYKKIRADRYNGADAMLAKKEAKGR